MRSEAHLSYFRQRRVDLQLMNNEASAGLTDVPEPSQAEPAGPEGRLSGLP